MDEYNLFCDYWDDQHYLQFNALINGVVMNSNGYVDDAQVLISIALSGNASLTVLIKNKTYTNAIACYEIEDAEFIQITECIDEILTEDVTTIVNDLLGRVRIMTK